MIQFGMRVHDICGKGTITEVLDKVQDLGIRYIQLAMSKSFSEVDTSVGHYNAGLGDYVGEELDKRNIHVSILGCYINPAHPDEEKRMLEVQRFIEHLKYSKRMGADMVGTETGRAHPNMKIVPETYTEENYQRVLDSFKRIRDAAEKLGVMVGVEGVFNHTLHSPEMMRRFLDDIDSVNFDVILDSVNLIKPEFEKDPEGQNAIIKKAFDLYGDRITTLHLKDGVFEDGDQRFRHPGEGFFNYEELMRQVSIRKPYIVGTLENSTPDRYYEDCRFLQEQYDKYKAV
ncbi:sugar phosphate isomerase/epimerase family protein [Oribacterium sp. FC2011]|uniref:sugar phosphate isomerase/epimerase family protein n=1 Tax=Oribacterium sp. FC2011 TaxID=1408311 RepID=UPI0004E1423F|nr:sugar phosphate isomerase/epimerase family protein [Oribacterium sp. FC2011]